MSLRRKLGVSILNMGLQRVLDLVTVLVVTALVVRSLSRQEYGMLSVVLSYGLVFNFLNVSVSAVLIRDYQKVKERVGEYVHAFVAFSLLKAALAVLLATGIGVFLYRRYHDPVILAVLGVNVVQTALLFTVEPFTTLLSVDFRQPALTKINLITSAANVLLSAGALAFPTALYVSAKNAAIAAIGLAVTVAYAKRVFRWGPPPSRREQLRVVRASFVGFSLWSHLIGVVTDVIYRADLLVLGWFGAPFRTIGNYNVALQMGNFTKLVPQILQYNATLGVSNSDDRPRREEITFVFVKYSLVVSVATILAYALFGRFVIRVVAATDVEEIYRFGFFIVGGLCLFNTFRPLVSYAIVAHSIRECFLFAILPSGICTFACYAFMGARWGAIGLAWANVCGGAIMTMFTLLYVRVRTEFTWRVALATDSEREFLARVQAKLRTW